MSVRWRFHEMSYRELPRMEHEWSQLCKFSSTKQHQGIVHSAEYNQYVPKVTVFALMTKQQLTFLGHTVYYLDFLIVVNLLYLQYKTKPMFIN